MILSQFEEAVWHWRGSDCDIAEAWHHGGEIVSAVEAVLEFGEVAGYMLVADGAVSGRKRARSHFHWLIHDDSGQLHRTGGRRRSIREVSRQRFEGDDVEPPFASGGVSPQAIALTQRHG